MSTPVQRTDESLFEAALKQDPADRETFLAAACTHDPDQLKRVAALLAAHDGTGGALERLLGPDLTGGNAPAPLYIGRYRILQQIGAGGCGIVYLAEQDEPVRRRVALKVIKVGMDTQEVIARFDAERQVLAMMEHPGIAKVLDAGSTSTGRPFFVMELVRGVPITSFCDQKKLSTEARLKLFIDVCHAVQHAHQKGIIHRDLKPSNILVALHDDVPVAKIIDFGIAKATAGGLVDPIAFTRLGQFLGTPAYMSPEQARMSVLDVDTRSDIYSLGVLLYELITGHTPFDARSLMKVGIDEMRRHICEVEAARPSTRLSTLDANTQRLVAQARQISTARLARRIAGDLDWIVMRCLEKEPVRRYETASTLALDVGRHLSNEPIVARPPSATYRLRKFVTRNRVAVAASAAVLLAVVAGAIISTLQAVRANRAERIAFQESQLSQAVNDFLIFDLLQQADSRAQADAKASPNPDLTVREALDRAGDKVGGRFEQQPLMEAAVRDAIGSAYSGVGDVTKAIRHHEEAFKLRKEALGPEHPKTLQSMSALAVALHAAGKYAEAEALHTQVLAAQKRVLGPEHPETIGSMNNLGMAFHSQAKYPEAAALFTQALALRQRILGRDHPNTLKVMNNLANAYRSQGKFAEAERVLAEVVGIWRRVVGPEHPFTLTSMNNLALTYGPQGKVGEAVELYEQTLGIRKRVLGPEHPDTLGTANNLALAYAGRGRFAEAIALHTETLEIQKRLLGSDHPSTLASMNNLASALNSAGRSAEAVALHASTLEARRRQLGPEHPNTVLSMNNLATAYRSAGRHAEAVALHRQAMEIRQRRLGADHADTLVSMSDLALDYHESGRSMDAIPLLDAVFKARRLRLGLQHPLTQQTVTDLASAYTAVGKAAEADALRSSVPTSASDR